MADASPVPATTNAAPAAAPATLWRHTSSADAGRCRITLDAARVSPHAVPAALYGKFCEHLGSNIYGGMEAQILENPTFARWRFNAGECSMEGGAMPEHDAAKIVATAQRHAEWRFGAAPPRLEEDLRDGLAFPWMRVGAKSEVQVSPDVGPHGGRAQRVETSAPARGVGVWTHLPLHRTRRYRFRVVARATREIAVALTLCPVIDGAASSPVASTTLALGDDWRTHEGELTIAGDARVDANGLYRVALIAPTDANLVVSRVVLYPDDAIAGADAEIVRLLKESRLPLLRWPGGNFVSGYRWRDGVGPVDARPTLPNPAWMGLEYNLFGTAEFIAFCRAVGCEPMICVNAGDGTPEEAAAWVEYCNGGVDTPMGRLRASHGHREPFAVRRWEVGNELWGRWQVCWTTPGGVADRHRRFSAAMKRADASIELIACGDQWWPELAWDQRIVREGGPQVGTIADHILTGGAVDHTMPAKEIYHAFMAQTESLAKRYADLRAMMRANGVADPRLAITELQQFARLRDTAAPAVPGGVDRATLPKTAAMSEALYFTTIAHMAVRLDGFVAIITHSATVNHGGGLKKHRERTWAEPVHWAHWLGRALAGGRPIAVDWTSATIACERELQNMPPVRGAPAVDVMAVKHDDGTIVLMLAHRSADAGAIRVALDVRGHALAPRGELHLLAARTWHDENTRDEPDRIVPVASGIAVRSAAVELELPPYAIARVTLPPGR